MKPGLLKILCMYSGGLDSLGVLYKLLTAEEYADYKILVHHMVLYNHENRADAEKIAVEKTLTYFREKDYRPFEYTESTHDYRFQKMDFIFDLSLCAFMAGSICATDVRIINVAEGITLTDIPADSNRLREEGIQVRRRKERMQMAQEIFKATLAVVRLKRKRAPKYIFPVMEMSKLDIWNMLPEKLRRMSWSCRTPIYRNGDPIHCMHCHTCMDLQKYGIMKRNA